MAVAGFNIGNIACKALAIDPSRVRDIRIDIPLDGPVRAIVEILPTDEQMALLAPSIEGATIEEKGGIPFAILWEEDNRRIDLDTYSAVYSALGRTFRLLCEHANWSFYGWSKERNEYVRITEGRRYRRFPLEEIQQLIELAIRVMDGE
jgi:hypothetical protein